MIQVCEGAARSDWAAEDSFTGRDNKAGFQSQGRALPGLADQASNRMGEVEAQSGCLGHNRGVWGTPGDGWLDQYFQGRQQEA